MTRLHKSLRNKFEKAIREYHMINDGDRILVGVSGGPDSLSLLQLLYERFLYTENNRFTIVAAHIDLGFGESEPCLSEQLASHFVRLNLDYRIIHTSISQQALAHDARKNPCFICSLYRRRKIYELAHKEACTKIAYGHHKDDIIETLLINILYGRKIEAMHPVQEVFKGKMCIIRPLAYIEEDLLKKFSLEANLPKLPRICPQDGKTRRQKVKEMIHNLQKTEKNANIRENIFRSLSHVNIASIP